MNLWFLCLMMVSPLWAQQPTDVVPEQSESEAEAGMLSLDEAPVGTPLTGAEALALAIEVGEKIRCPQCQGLSVSASKADAAEAMFGRILELVEQGYDEEQILAYFESRYGTGILLEPPAEGMNWLIWLGPGTMLLMGAGWIVLRARKDKAQTKAASGQETSSGPTSEQSFNEEEAGLLRLDAQREREKDPYVQAILNEVAERSKEV